MKYRRRVIEIAGATRPGRRSSSVSNWDPIGVVLNPDRPKDSKEKPHAKIEKIVPAILKNTDLTTLANNKGHL